MDPCSGICHHPYHKTLLDKYLRMTCSHLPHLVLQRVAVNQDRMGAGNTILSFIQIYLRVYDFLTGWIYNILHRPGAKLKEYSAVRAVPCAPIKPGDTQVTYKPVPIKATALVRDFEHAHNGTMADVWTWCVARYGSRRLLGTRDQLGEDDEVQSNGTVFKKLLLGTE